MGEWSKLNASQKAKVIKWAMNNGVSDINVIRDTYNIYASGGKIHIAPSKRGTFTAAATKHGKSVQEFARQVLANKENYSPAMVKKANFARNAAKWHSTGGYLNPENPITYPFSFSQDPLPQVRYVDGGPIRNWDNTLTGKLINYVENPDSIGWNPSDRTWEHPTDAKKYDINQIGMGVDKNQTPGYWNFIQYRNNKAKTPYLTELNERLLRFNAIEEANKSANQRYKYAQSAVNRPKGTISKVKDAAVVSAIYNLGAGNVANGLFEDKDFMLKLFDGTNKEVIDRINLEYKKKNRNDRIRRTNEFLTK